MACSSIVKLSENIVAYSGLRLDTTYRRTFRAMGRPWQLTRPLLAGWRRG